MVLDREKRNSTRSSAVELDVIVSEGQEEDSGKIFTAFSFHLICNLCALLSGVEHPGPTQVPPRSEPSEVRQRGEYPTSAGPVRHRHTPPASGHPGNQDQEHDLQDQTQA